MNKTGYSWLQLSDLHIFKSTDWNIMEEAYKKLSEVIHPDFLVVTGDFRHKKYNKNYEAALKFLNKIVDIFDIKKEDVFLVPGNHDTNNFQFRKEIITTINSVINSDADAYQQYMSNDNGNLKDAFDEYHRFVKDFYGDTITDERINHPFNVININWKNKANIVLLNSALISCGNENEKEIVDINTLSTLTVNNELPTIVLSHHSILDLVESHAERMPILLERINTKIFLCGDKHRIIKKGIDRKDVPNTSIPMITAGKSANEPQDSYSDLCVIEYEYKEDGFGYVQVYRYENHEFTQSNDFYHHVNQKFSFPLCDFKFKDISSQAGNEITQQSEEIASKTICVSDSTFEKTPDIGETISLGIINDMPLTWKVLDKNDQSIFLMCSQSVCSQPFNDTDYSCNWEESSLKKWLNNQFLNEALKEIEPWILNVAERKGHYLPILNTTIAATDKLFILSIQEVLKYCSNMELSRLPVSNFNSKEIIYSYKGNTWWWLRNQGKFNNFSAGVMPNGKIDYIGNLNIISNAVRPAFWVDSAFLNKKFK